MSNDPEMTMTAEEAAELYEAAGGEVVGRWTKVGDRWPCGQSRWHNRYWLVVRDPDDAIWGIEYGIGLTEDQEHDLPWTWSRDPLSLTRLYAHTVTKVEYRAVAS